MISQGAESHVTGPCPLETALARFADATPGLVGERQLLCRREVKLLLPRSRLPAVLHRFAHSHAALRAGDTALARYVSLYFDTVDLRCFHDHLHGRFPRHKVRVRHHLDRGLTYLEVKTTTSPGRNDKQRFDKRFLDFDLSVGEAYHVAGLTGQGDAELVPQVWTSFRRITLAGLHTAERLTLDLDLALYARGQTRPFPDAVVVEVKRAPDDPHTGTLHALAELGAEESRVSKYATTILLTDAPGYDAPGYDASAIGRRRTGASS